MLYRIVKNISLILIGFALAFVAILARDSYVTKQSDFWQISFFNLLQLFAYLFIGIIVAHYFKNRYSDKQIQKNLFLGVLNDIVKILENESDFILEFMRETSKTKNSRIRVLLLLKKISNKIRVLEENNHWSNRKIKKHVAKLREHFDLIDEIIGDGDFVRARSISEGNINKVLKNIYDIIFLVDQIKLNMFN